MGSQLLIRSYNVGCGDCFYVQIPNGDDGFHILIDCGSKESASSGVLKRAIKHMADDQLPDSDQQGKKRLDLIVVTHRHEDHIKGFDPNYFKNIEVKNIWITAAMNPNHVQATKSNNLHHLVKNQIKQLSNNLQSLSPELRDMVSLYGVNNDNATKALLETIPNASGIEPTFVFAGVTSDDHNFDLDDNTKIKVLAPEEDIDHFYLGKDIDTRLNGFNAGVNVVSSQTPAENPELPFNLNPIDFRNLKESMLSNALAFAVDDSSIQNNVSTVLLIEWHGKRLLFVGDAEWDNGYKENRKNASWNVMWHERKSDLEDPIDFLKVGHHGSHNATPWNRHHKDHEVNEIFNAILPEPAPGEVPTAKCIVSTKRKQYDTIPDAQLLVELGKRVSNVQNYKTVFEAADPTFDPEEMIYNFSVLKEYSDEPSPREVGDKEWFNHNQPPRTDFESAGRGSKDMIKQVEFIDVKIDSDQ